jgi:hypothetical protein
MHKCLVWILNLNPDIIVIFIIQSPFTGTCSWIYFAIGREPIMSWGSSWCIRWQQRLSRQWMKIQDRQQVTGIHTAYVANKVKVKCEKYSTPTFSIYRSLFYHTNHFNRLRTCSVMDGHPSKLVNSFRFGIADRFEMGKTILVDSHKKSSYVNNEFADLKLSSMILVRSIVFNRFDSGLHF